MYDIRRRTSLATVALASALCACSHDSAHVYSGTLEVPDAAVGSTVGGRVMTVLVSEGAKVRAGQVLVRFDDAQQQADLTSATARLGQARAALADLRAGAKPDDLARAQSLAEQQRAQYELAKSTEPYQSTVLVQQLRAAESRARDARAAALDARRDANRMENLAATGDVSKQQRDAAVTKAAHADADVTAALAAIRSAQAQLDDATRVQLPQTAQAALAAYQAAAAQYRSLAAPPRPDAVREAEAAVRAAQGEVAGAQRRLREGAVRAPVNGVVRAIDLHPGDLVVAGASVATIDESGTPFTRIYVPQAELGRLTVGARVAVQSDAVPKATFEGEVASVDAQAQFTPQNVQTSSDRAVLAFGVKVWVRDPKSRLFGGTTVEVSVP
jgi:HlyD family secretion protein